MPARDGNADLKVSATFDKPSYKATDQARVHVTIKNDGDVAAEGVRAAGGGDLDVWGAWDVLGAKPGVRIEPHETRTAELSGRILNATNGKVTFNARVTAETGDANPADNGTFVEVPLTQATGVFAGTIVADLNDNGTIDPGEGLAGVRILFERGGVPPLFTQTTDAQGRFSFTDIPAGAYFVRYDSQFPWVVTGLSGQGSETVTIDDSGRFANVSITAVRRLNESLRVGMTFDQPSYAPGDTTKVRITFSNTSTRPIAGVTAECQSFGDGPDLRGGPGWGALAPGADGVTIPARATKTVEVTEAVPAGSPKFGYVSAFCLFGPANLPRDGWPSASATALVPGTRATGAGRIAEDLNKNFRVDPGEERSGVTVVIADQDTGVEVARATTNDEGRFVIADLQTGVYDLRITGPWKSQGFNLDRLVVAADRAFVQDYLVESRSGQQGGHPNLRVVSAAFDKPAYESGDTIHVTLTVSNVGDGDAEGVKASNFEDPAALVVDQFHGGWGELNRFGNGTKIAVGQTRTFDIFGTARNIDAGAVTFTGSVFTTGPNGDSYFPNNQFDIAAPLTKITGQYSGVIYGDTNKNGKPDDGEGLAGILVFINGGVPVNFLQQATNAQGHFDFGQLPAGKYGVGFEDPTGRWVPLGESGEGFDSFVLGKSGHADVAIRAIPPLSDSLVPSIKFTEESYAEGDIAHLTVTLTNKGTVDLTGITATCLTEVPNGLRGGPGWGQLNKGAAGVSVAAGTTGVFDVSEPVPVGSRESGDVFAVCSFGATGNPSAGHPFAEARARVPGAIGHGTGRLAQPLVGDDSEFPKAGEPIPNTKVVLLDGFTGEPVAKTRTDSDGRFTFSGLPAGTYELVVVGPWKFFHESSRFFFVSESGSSAGDILLVPGPEQPDLFPDTPEQTPSEPAPAPQASAAPAGLASTGASVFGLTVLSLVLVLAGFGAVVAGRRRRARSE